jgi:protoporphyrinogen oxidase
MSTVNIITEIDGDELWSRIWGAEPWAFGSWWRVATYESGTDWDKAGQVHVCLEDHTKGEGTREVTPATITLDKIVKALNHPDFPAHLRQNIMTDNADCIDADAVIQFIVYGEVVYG